MRYTMPLGAVGLPGRVLRVGGSPRDRNLDRRRRRTVRRLGGPAGRNRADDRRRTVNPIKTPAPDLTAAWYIPQPWGHVDFAGVIRPTLQFKDGFGTNGIEKNYMGWGVQFSGDVKPGWFGWDRDTIQWHVSGGDAIGRYIQAGSGNSMVGLVSNYGAPGVIPGTASAPGNILIKPVVSWAATSAIGTIGRRTCGRTSASASTTKTSTPSVAPFVVAPAAQAPRRRPVPAVAA